MVPLHLLGRINEIEQSAAQLEAFLSGYLMYLTMVAFDSLYATASRVNEMHLLSNAISSFLEQQIKWITVLMAQSVIHSLTLAIQYFICTVASVKVILLLN